MANSQSNAMDNGMAALGEDSNDEYGDLNLSFDDLDEDALIHTSSLQGEGSDILSPPPTMSAAATASLLQTASADHSITVSAAETSETVTVPAEDYILGTLIVRVVAARDLEPVHKHNLGNLLFGTGGGSSKMGGSGSSIGGGGIGGSLRSSRSTKGTANPYASVRFGNTTQRTSEAYETTDPTWSRGEAMYMDVTHKGWTTIPATTTSSKNLDSSSNASGQKDSNTAVAHPGVPPKKSHLYEPDSPRTSSTTQTAVPSSQRSSPSSSSSSTELQQPILTVAVFHANEVGRLSKFPTKSGSSSSGDSDDVFLGMTAVNLTHILTGKIRTFDEWLPLQGTNSAKAAVRVVCEYETSDAPPLPGDIVKFTDFCHPFDLYPAIATAGCRTYTVQESDGDDVLISWTSSAEGWVSTFMVHRFMLICLSRHHSVVDLCQDELASIRERIAYSPMVHVVQQSVDRIPDDGLLTIGTDAVVNGVSLLSRWWDQGIATTARDLNFATNWDGRHNPSTTDSLATVTFDSTDESDLMSSSQLPVDALNASSASNSATTTTTTKSGASNSELLDSNRRLLVLEPLPNMPPCPITGEAMRDPVVAADGHTYERSAIARWLTDSNKSPLTGAILSHKDLVPNYMLLSSLRETASALAKNATSVVAPSSSLTKPETVVGPSLGAIGIEEVDDEESTAEVNID